MRGGSGGTVGAENGKVLRRWLPLRRVEQQDFRNFSIDMLDFGDGRVTFRILPLGLDHVLTSHVIGIRRGEWTGIADCLFVRVVWLAQGRERAER